jgi:hypothetical protein
MNTHERSAWQTLVRLGAASIEIGGKPALDLATVRVRNRRNAALFVDAVIQVSGRSGAVHRHMDREGRLVFVVNIKTEGK